MEVKFVKKPDIRGTLLKLNVDEEVDIKFSTAKRSAVSAAASRLNGNKKINRRFTCSDLGIVGTTVRRIK